MPAHHPLASGISWNGGDVRGMLILAVVYAAPGGAEDLLPAAWRNGGGPL